MFLEAASAGGAVADGTVAQDAGQASAFWAIRESITESLAKNGAVYKYDLSLPAALLYRLVEETQQRIGEGMARAYRLGWSHMNRGGQGPFGARVRSRTFFSPVRVPVLNGFWLLLIRT